MRTAHEFALEGFAFPYGDVALLNSQLVLAQRAVRGGAEHRRVPGDPEPARRAAHGEDAGGCRRLPRAPGGLRRPDRRRNRTAQERRGAERDRAGFPARQDAEPAQARARRQRSPSGRWSTSLGEAHEGRCRGDYAARAAKIAADKIAPALDRQIAELEAHRRRATSDAGVWKLPRGDEYYAWALRAGTTTRMTPDEIHAARPGRTARVAVRDGRHPEEAGHDAGHRRRTHDGARQGGALPRSRRAMPAARSSWPFSMRASPTCARACRARSRRWCREISRSSAWRRKWSRARRAPTAARAPSTARCPASSGSTCTR